jgi:large subunit ribosomal protein L18
MKMDRAKQKVEARSRIRQRVRRKVSGTPERPRLAVFKSLKYIYAQVIDDSTGKTVAAASSLESALRDKIKGSNLRAAKAVGELIADRMKEKGVTKVVFDRGGYQYHGKIKALAEAARSNGLVF